jgi:hypothetical protein
MYMDFSLFCDLCMRNTLKLYSVSECDILYLLLLYEQIHPSMRRYVLQYFMFEMHTT